MWKYEKLDKSKEGNSLDVQIIKGNNSRSEKEKRRKTERQRVAAYCRVSTDDEEQSKSYNSMVQYYTDMIEENKHWIFAGVYADEAVTGTKDNRENFQRLIQDCLSGKIDLVLTKSISRFARNTLDTIKYVRMLKEKNVAIYFEMEHINTLEDGEFLLTILGSVAQQEVVNTSGNVKKGLKMKMQRGELVGFNRCMGYDYNRDTKELTVNEEEASVIRYIFDRYVAGAGANLISRELNAQGFLTIRGNKWAATTVMSIVKNEKYKGDLCQGKTFTQDPITKRRLKNYGEEDQYYIKDHHEAIVSREVWDKANEVLRKRSIPRSGGCGRPGKYSRQYAFSCMLECGYCEGNLSRRRWHSNTNHQKTIWQCVKATKKGKKYCPDSKGIEESIIESAFIESYKMICQDNTDVLEEFIRRIEKTLKEDSSETAQKKLRKKLADVKNKRKKLLDNFLNGAIAQDIYEDMDSDLVKKKDEIEIELKQTQNQQEDKESLEKRLKEFRNALLKNEVIEKFDRGIFESMVEKVIIGGYDDDGNKDPYRITFIYKTGFKNSITKLQKKKLVHSQMNDKVKEECSDGEDNTR